MKSSSITPLAALRIREISRCRDPKDIRSRHNVTCILRVFWDYGEMVSYLAVDQESGDQYPVVSPDLGAACIGALSSLLNCGTERFWRFESSSLRQFMVSLV